MVVRFWDEASKVSHLKDQSQISNLRADDYARSVEDRLASGILKYLNGRNPTTSEGLKSILYGVLVPPSVENTNIPGLVEVLSLDEGSHVYVIYSVISCASCSESWLAEFQRRNGVYQIGSTFINTFPNSSVYFGSLEGSRTKKALVVYGKHWGDSQNRMDVKVFAVGDAMQEILARKDLIRGEVIVKKDELILTTLKDPMGKESVERIRFDSSGLHPLGITTFTQSMPHK